MQVLQERTKLKVQVLQGNGCDELLKVNPFTIRALLEKKNHENR